jgi:hypothetical protein
VPAKTADAIITENATARIDALRTSLSLLALIALIALFTARRIPARQPSAAPSEPSPQSPGPIPDEPDIAAPSPPGRPPSDP